MIGAGNLRLVQDKRGRQFGDDRLGFRQRELRGCRNRDHPGGNRAQIGQRKFGRIAQAQQAEGIEAQIVELEKVASYARGKAVMGKPWAVMPGDETADTAVAKACASGLINT